MFIFELIRTQHRKTVIKSIKPSDLRNPTEMAAGF